MTEAAPASAPVPAPPGTDYPGKTLGIVGLILAFVFTIVGLILSIIANGQSKAAGYTNGPAKAGIIVSIVLIVLGIIGGIIFALTFGALFGGLAQICNELGPGVHEVNGVTYTCG
ncbi:DUF4190 domain-containing protein [Leifsonia sp. H3M29-4]|uniref:DUF4190 domain-containing protein n=1 Tax=Salinibacterium metalliresistens TaxID=3031321 RepID=UPI0023D9983E|nr:DUF4190 domain-containing protein [Salinibacterium metalliresistens]MDF1477828.1 DUF4190 domain-containing protein [Salinibacterium metalliresistens]